MGVERSAFPYTCARWVAKLAKPFLALSYGDWKEMDYKVLP